MVYLVSQGIVAVILLGLGFYLSKQYEFKLSIYHITICALMIGISVILQLYSMTIPLFGFPSLKIGFGQLPIMVLGIILNPAYAFLVGIVKDIVGLIVAPSGPPFLGFTLNTVLVGVIPALCYHSLKHASLKLLKVAVTTVVVLLGGLSAMVILMPSLLHVDGFVISWEIKLLLLVVLVGIVGVLLHVAYRKQEPLLLIYALAVALVEMVVNFASTPIYLNVLYEIPVLPSLMARFFKAIFLYPVSVSVGYMVLRVVMRIKKNEK